MMSSMSYKRLLKLVPQLFSLEEGAGLKSKVSGFMGLNLDVIHKNTDTVVIALSHYYTNGLGDLIADPDMELRVYKGIQTVEALAYQDSFGYKKVWLDENRYYPKLRKSLNSFLGQWLKNCTSQGHQF